MYGYGNIASTYSRFQMEKDNATGAYNLVIPSVTMNDAGRYECQDDFGRGAQSDAELIVIETPVCTSATDLTKVVGTNNCGIKSDQLLLSCIVQYKGNEPPVMKWRKTGEQTTIDSPIAPAKPSSDRIIYNVTMDGSSVVNGSAFECFASRAAAAAKTRCLTTNATVISRVVLCEVCSCSCVGSIFLFIFVVIVIGAAIAASWHCFYFQNKKEVKEKYEEYMDEVFCMNFIPFFIGAALGLYWYLQRYRPQKKQIDQLKEKKQLIPSRGESNEEKYVATLPVEGTPETQGKTNTERLEQRIRELELKNKDQEEKQNKLLERIQELEQDLYSSDRRPVDYVEKPSAVHTIITGQGTEENRPIVGLAVLGKSLFVSHEKTPAIEVYDSATYVSQGQIRIPRMAEPLDIASCVQQSCLFVIGRLESSKESTSDILRIKSDGEVEMKWQSGGNFGRLSTYESNVIVCLSDRLLVREFTPEGELLHEVRLSPAAGFNHLSHAIKVTSMHFVVSHGEKDDKVRRVCLVDRGGNILKKFELKEKSKFPVCLLNDRGRAILVGDAEGRIILLSSNLGCERNLLEKADKYIATRISFDETEKRLFVARNKVSSKPKDSKAGQVLVFNVK